MAWKVLLPSRKDLGPLLLRMMLSDAGTSARRAAARGALAVVVVAMSLDDQVEVSDPSRGVTVGASIRSVRTQPANIGGTMMVYHITCSTIGKKLQQVS